MPSNNTSHSWPFYTIVFSVLAPVLAALLVFQLDSFDPAPMPNHELTHPPPEPSMKNGRLLQGAEFLGVGQLKAPEDIAYDSESGFIYTTCEDGWIKRLTVNDSVVENWVNTGGRPLGIVLGHGTDIIVADAYKVEVGEYRGTRSKLSSVHAGTILARGARRRCRKYYIKGNKKGSLEKFIDLPRLPDNIHYDGHDHFWIASAWEITTYWKIAFKYPLIRKVAGIIFKHIGKVDAEKNGGVFMVDLEGNLISHYYDPKLKRISSGVKIGNHLYFGSVIYPYIIRLDLAKNPAHPNTRVC